MIQSWQDTLDRLSRSPADDLHARIAEHVGAEEAVRIEPALRAMILAAPAMLQQIAAWSRELGMPRPLQRAQSFALAYIVNPDDLVPESRTGLFGYLDDAYLVAATYYRTMQEVGPAGLRPLTDNVPLAIAVPEWVDAFRRFWPEAAEWVEELLDANTEPNLRHRPPRPKIRGPLNLARAKVRLGQTGGQ